MNFSISKNAFASATSIVDHAISSTHPQAPLRGMKIQAKEDKLTLTGSNSDISIELVIPSDDDNHLVIVEEGTILIESRYLLDIVKKMDSEIITIEVIDGSLTRFSGERAVYKINGMNVFDYPAIEFSKPEDSITMKTGMLKDIIDQTAFATAVKETRPVLTGVNFRLEDHVLKCTGTDSYRLAKKTIPFNTDGSFNVTIPAKTLNDVKSTMITDTDEDMEIALNPKKAQFIIENMVLQTRLLDGSFPDIDRLIPDTFSYVLSINRNELIRSIDRTTFIRSDNMAVNRLQCSSDEIILTSKSQEIGESRENLDATFTGEDLDISFSGNYVIDAAKALRGDNITINFSGDMRPFVLKDEDDETVLQLVLPLRTYN